MKAGVIMSKSFGARLGTVLALTVSGLVGVTTVAPSIAGAVGATPTTFIGPVPLTSLTTYSGAPTSFVNDGAGNIWFSNATGDPSGGDYGNRLWKATSGGAVTAAHTGAAAITDITAGPGGDVYFVEGGNTVKKVSGGTVSTVAGTGATGTGGQGDAGLATDAPLNTIVDIAVDGAGKVYIVEVSGQTRFVNAGNISTYTTAIGTSCVGLPTTLGSAALPTPTNIAADASGNVFASLDCGLDGFEVVKFDTGGTISLVFGGGVAALFSDGSSATAARLTTAITSLGLGPDGPYFSSNGRLLKVTSGNVNFVAGQSLDQAFVTGTNAALTDVGEFFVEASGSILVTGASPATGLGRLSPTTLTVVSPGFLEPANGANVLGRAIPGMTGLSNTPTGDLLLTTATKFRTVTIAGIITTIAGSGTTAAPAAGAALSSPLQNTTRPAVDAAGNTYGVVGDKVVKITPVGTLSLVAGGTTLTPVAVAAAPDGTVYIAETNGVVRKVTTDGTVSTLASTGVTPSDLALAADGSLVLAPTSGNNLVKITIAGVTSNLAFSPGLGSPAVAVDTSGTAYVAQSNGLFAVTAAGVASQVGATGGSDLTIVSNGDLYVLSGTGVYKYIGLGTPAAAFLPVLGADAVATRVGVAVTAATAVNDRVPTGSLGAPTVVAAPSHGTAVFSGANALYTPTSGFTGVDQFTYQVCNAAAVSACATATVTVTVANPILTAVAPSRLFDTRPGEPQGTVPVPKQKMGGGTLFRIKVLGVSGVPASGVGAVSLNVTVADPVGAGYVTVYPCGTLPLVSSVNYVAGQVVPNAVLAPVSDAGEVCFFTSDATHLIADVNSWLATSTGFATVAPVRLFDTRPTDPAGVIAVTKAKIGGTTELKVKLTDIAGIPATGVGAVSLNVTAVDPDTAGFVTVYPCGTRPVASSLNFVAGQVVPNAVIAPVSASGEVCFFSNTPTHLVADVNGWFATAAGFSAVSPSRVFDTRTDEAQGTVQVTKTKVGGANVLKVKFTGVSGVPSVGVAAVSLNVTVVNPTDAGFVTVYPCGTLPLASSVNFLANQVVPNAVIAPLSADGEVCFYSNVNTDLLADVNGWFNG
jgi:hypothetical protein